MMKNLKKVISAIAALAVSASSFVALAAGFPDVAETADYAQAVNELTALNIVNGYEDGTFGPDKLVTRAEITKMIVAALGSTSEAEAAAARDTEFTDVKGTHWAAGYVTVGTSSGSFINGMGDGTFAPDANVTYAQAVKMLVSATGYQTWAESAGGYPQGYLAYGSQLEITDGVKAGNDTELNRGQVAMLIANALDAPLLVKNGYEQNVWGQSVPKLEQMDGTGEYWQTLLTNNHDAFKVYGRVTATQQSAGLEPGEVSFRVERADNFDDQYVDAKSAGISETVLVGNTDADKHLLTYAEAIIAIDDNDDYVMVCITPSGKNATVEFNADDYADDSRNYKDGNGNQLTALDTKEFYVYESGTRTKTYKLADGAEFFVNGVSIGKMGDGSLTPGEFANYITNNENGVVTLVDTAGNATGVVNGSTSTDGKYDYVQITYYLDAVVEEVTPSAVAPQVFFKNSEIPSVSNLKVDFEDETRTYKFLLDGEEIAVTDLLENDVLSVAYNVTGTFSNSNFYEVLVSRDSVTGKVTSYSVEDGYAIDGTYYEVNANMVSSSAITNGDDYTLFLNAFGKVANYELGATSKLYGILESVYQQYGSTWYATLIDNTGNKVAYELNDQTAYTAAQTIAANTNVEDRVVTYKVNSYDRLTITGQPTDKTGGTTEAYVLRTNRLGTIRLGDNTSFINYVDSSDVSSFDVSFLTDDEVYEAYGYGKLQGDNTYSFVLVKGLDGSIGFDSSLAIYSSKGNTSTEDDSNATQFKIYVDGEAQYVIVDSTCTLPTDQNGASLLVNGTPILYAVNGDGYIKDVDLIMDVAMSSDYATFTTNVFNAAPGAAADFNDAVNVNFREGNTVLAKANGVDKAFFAFGPVLDKDSNSVTIADYSATGTSNIATAKNYGYDTEVDVYVYDYNNATRNDGRLSVGATGSVAKTYVDPSAKILDGDGVDWNVAASKNTVNYALVKVVNGDVVAAYSIIAPTE